ncbi:MULTISPECIES: sugar ABC transporter substrate-binding protein [Cytobacillus]|uniref:sugar ABC transporter substrate-binding protein n=1 Tax=Cytobacillus TaxID=2675230 RepID=UPI0020404685|nr:extracellular solute-binding protein [Cytobacillus firmus]MCM3706944.1 extracellular solute-binding protein [Cytobacillus firmus]
MKKSVLSLVSFLTVAAAALTGCQKQSEADAQPADNGVVTISAWSEGAEVTRLTNLEKASEKLNEELKSQGKDIQVKVEPKSFDGGWDQYAKQFMLSAKAGKAPDIYITPHETIGWLADGNYIMPLDELRDSKEYADVFPKLWDAASYNGHIWGALQDNEARPVFYNKNILKDLGWNETEIEELPEKVRRGEFTLDDMTKLAEEVVKQGKAKYGVIHRPVNGADFHYFNYLFGGQLYSEEDNKIVLDKSAVGKQLAYHYELAQKKLLPDKLISMEWKNVHRMVVNGETLFYYGGIWNVFNWGNDNFHDQLGKVDAKWVNENFGMMLVPAAEKGGEPITLSHPFLYTVNAKTKHPDLTKRLLELVADPKLQTEHNLQTFHLPVTERAAEDPEFKTDLTLGNIAYMSEYTTFLPNHEGFTKYSNVFWNSLQAVELGKQTPDQALESMEAQLKVDLGEDLKIVE